MITKGKLIIVDGIDGCGKTTISKYIAEKIGGVTMPALGTGPIGKEIRRQLLETGLNCSNPVVFNMMMSSVLETYCMHVIPALEAGQNVVLDRFATSSYAYQVHPFPKDNLYNSWWQLLNEMLKKQMPDLYIWLDVPLDTAISRIKARGGLNVFEEKAMLTMEKTVEGYRYFFINQLLPNSAVIQAENELAEVLNDIDNSLRDFTILGS